MLQRKPYLWVIGSIGGADAMFKNCVFIIIFAVCFLSLENVGSEEVTGTSSLGKSLKRHDAISGTVKIPKGMALIPSGKLTRGSDPKQAQQICLKNNDNCKEKWFQDEEPVHAVKLNSFYMDTREVIQKDFLSVMGMNPSYFKGSNLPVERVNWFEAMAYCQRIGKRLPTEAEWEWAAKGGNNWIFVWGNKAESHKANFCDRECGKRWKERQFEDGYRHTAPVGSFPANDYGLFDMAGNVYEWVMDWYKDDYYLETARDDPKGPVKGTRKVIRGGSWINYSVGVRPSDRTDAKPLDKINFVGFRCAL